MSAVRGPGHDPDDTFQFAPSPSVRLPRDASPAEKIRLAVALRNEWLAVGLSTAPANRPIAEAAVGRLYEMAGAPPPAFEWAASPLAALEAVLAARSRYPAIQPPRSLVLQHVRQWPVAARLASLGSSLRSRLDARIRRAEDGWADWRAGHTGAVSLYGPEDAIASGVSDRSVVVATVGQSLRWTLADAVAAPLRAALAQAVGQAAEDDELNPAGGVIAFRSQPEAAWIGYYDTRRRAGFGAAGLGGGGWRPAFPGRAAARPTGQGRRGSYLRRSHPMPPSPAVSPQACARQLAIIEPGSFWKSVLVRISSRVRN